MNKTHTGTHTGPITLNVRLTAGQIRVVAEDRARAEIVVSTPDSSGPSVEAVTNTRISDLGDTIEVDVPDNGGGGVTIQSGGGVTMVNSGSGMFIAGNVVGGSIISSGRDTFINGQRVTGGGAVHIGGSGISVEARVPRGSSVRANTTAADITVTGEARAVNAGTMSGDVYVSQVQVADVRTMSGDVEIAALSAEARIKTMSGDIEVTADPASAALVQVRASSMSGDITARGRVDLDGRSMSGRVRNR